VGSSERESEPKMQAVQAWCNKLLAQGVACHGTLTLSLALRQISASGAGSGRKALTGLKRISVMVVLAPVGAVRPPVESWLS
jgi:hypothetical protein